MPEVISTGRGCFLTSLGVLLFAALLPGGLWLLTEWRILAWKLELLVAILIVATVWIFACWTLGWVHNRYVLWQRPCWIVHPLTRTVILFFCSTFVAGLPFAFVQNGILQLYAIFLAPLTGLIVAFLWLIVVLIVWPETVQSNPFSRDHPSNFSVKGKDTGEEVAEP